MRLLVVRHAEAVPQGTPGLADADRPLTEPGTRRFRAVVPVYARLQPELDVLLTSPLLRARQTAALLARAWRALEPVAEPALASGSVTAILAALEYQPRDAGIALVGHEPTVSALVAELVGLSSSEAVAFGVGSAALLDVASLSRRSARLVWYLTAALAANLGEGNT